MPIVCEIEHLYQPSGWLSPGYITIADDGLIDAVSSKPPSHMDPTERLAGYGIPGFPNVHSHAFQRALAGRCEFVTGAAREDNLWTWRRFMYDLVSRVQPEHYEAIAAFAFLEMVKYGITAVGEFHYVHHTPEATPYDNPAEMADRLIAAAGKVGIRMTLMPVLYAHGGIGQPPTRSQRRFVHSRVDEFLKLVELVRVRHKGNTDLESGVALHSLRAVSPEEIGEAISGALAMDSDCRLHIHVSEQLREVEECVYRLGLRPVQWLLERVELNEQWTVVHATHVDESERRGLATCGAVVGLCPVTEATLGDGIFPLFEYQQENGRWGIGTDSHYTASHAEELRVLEYGQRLRVGKRNVLAASGNVLTAHSGRRLFDLALSGGRQSLGLPTGAITPGCRADLVFLDPRCPTILAHGPETVIDAWILSGTANPVRDVMVGGQWIVRNGIHEMEDRILADYEKAMKMLITF